MKKENKESICLSCLYGSQPYCYYPIVCVQGKRSKKMWHDVHKCKHFEQCPDDPDDSRLSDTTQEIDTATSSNARMIQLSSDKFEESLKEANLEFIDIKQ